MMRIFLMSSRRGMSGGVLDLGDETVEQVERVVRAGAGLGVVLDRGAGDVAQREPLNGAVVEVDVRQLGGAEVGLPAHRLVGRQRLRAARAQDREAVVLARDLDA